MNEHVASPASTRTAAWILRALRRLVRALQTNKPIVSALERTARFVVAIPLFSLLVFILRLRLLLRRPPLEVIARSSDGLVFRCRPPDLIQMYVWVFGIWEPDLSSFVVSRLQPGDVFLDVGANIGYFSALAARRVQPTGMAIAVEASPLVFSLLEETVGRNALTGSVRSINAAAAARSGDLELYSGPSHNIGLTTTVAHRGFALQATVPGVTLDEALATSELEALRVIKIDVEGGEGDVLRGMQRILAFGRRDLEIVLELSPKWWKDGAGNARDILAPLFDAGFNAYEIENNYWPWRYLWPKRVSRPRRCRRDLAQPIDRLDLVFSRQDAETL